MANFRFVNLKLFSTNYILPSLKVTRARHLETQFWDCCSINHISLPNVHTLRKNNNAIHQNLLQHCRSKRGSSNWGSKWSSLLYQSLCIWFGGRGGKSSFFILSLKLVKSQSPIFCWGWWYPCFDPESKTG